LPERTNQRKIGLKIAEYRIGPNAAAPRSDVRDGATPLALRAHLSARTKLEAKISDALRNGTQIQLSRNPPKICAGSRLVGVARGGRDARRARAAERGLGNAELPNGSTQRR